MKAEMSKHIKFTLNPIHWIKQIEFNIIGQITRIGFPIGIQFMTVFISLTLLQNMVSALGSSNLAAVTIVIRFIFILGLPVIAFTDAVTSIVGISLGAEKIKRAVRTSNYAIILSLLFTMFITSLTTLFNHEIIMFFAEFENSTDIEEVLRLGIIALKYIIVIIFCWIPVFVYGGAFKGAGDTIPPLISGIIRSALIFLFFMANHPSMQVLPKFVLKSNPFENILLITTIAFGIEGIIIFIWFHRKKWIEKSFLNMQRVSSQ